MTRHVSPALLTATLLAMGTGLAAAQTLAPPPAPDLYGAGPARGRLTSRALRDFDLNKDGRITKAELAKVTTRRFAQAAGGAATMTGLQFLKSHEAMLREHSNAMFHRLDWNGDGVLSLEEFRAPIRARLESSQASATISCASTSRPTRSGARARRPHVSARIARLCRQADFNKDGKVTHAEFDRAIANRYAAAVKGHGGMTAEEFYGLRLARFQPSEMRRFKRLDTNHDGKLSEIEFAAPANRLFARLDRNKDGILSKDELVPPRRIVRGKRGARPG